MSQNTRITIGLDKLTNTFASADETTGDAPTAHTGLALCSRCHPVWESEGTLVGPGKDTHGTPVPTLWEGGGWPTSSYTRHHQHDKTKVTASRLGYQHGCGAGSLRPQICEAPTDAWRQEHVHTTDPGKTRPKSFMSDSVEVPQVQFEPILVKPSRPRDSDINEPPVTDATTYQRI